MSRVRATIVVVGSLNLDYIASVDRLPSAGQTVPAGRLIRRFGGKGANQAVAAARQGAAVKMIGCVGQDDDGRAYIRRLMLQSIDVTGVSQSATALTGTALIAVDRKAENIIIVAPGANGQLTHKRVGAHQSCITKATALLLQFEIPMSTILAAIECATHAGVPVILNPSPLREDFPWGKCKLSTLIVNDGEAQAIFGLKTSKASPGSWNAALRKFKVSTLVITRGARPTLCFSGTEKLEVPTLPVTPLDTVGAGDAFAGTFAARRGQGIDLLTTIRLANCAGALTTLKSGAQEAMPGRAATQRALRTLMTDRAGWC